MAATPAPLNTRIAAELELRNRNRKRWATDPVAYSSERFGHHMTPDQAAALMLLAQPNGPRRVSVKAANATGKTDMASVATCWWMDTKEDPLCYTTAPTDRQIKANLWKNIRGLHRDAVPPLPGVLLPKDARWDLTPTNFAMGVAASNEESLKGGHAPDFLIVVDEAQGVDAGIMHGISTMAKGRRARILLIGNTSSKGGEFYDSFHDKAAIYSTLTISAATHPNVVAGLQLLGVDWETWKLAPHGQLLLPDDWEDPIPGAVSLDDLDTAKVDYGVDTPAWQVVVEGIFPSAGDRTLIELAWIEQARTGELNRSTLPDYLSPPSGKRAGLDVARYGPDRSVLTLANNGAVESIEEWQGFELSHTAGKALKAIRDGYTLTYDEGGLGAAITSHLKEQGVRIGVEAHPNNAGSSPTSEKHYPKMRDQLWGSAADLLRAQHIDLSKLPVDQYRKLLGEWSVVEYELDSASRRKVESKDQLKKRIGRSPDIADSVNLALHQPADTVVYRMSSFFDME